MKNRPVFLPLLLVLLPGCSLVDRVRDNVSELSDPRKSVDVPKNMKNAERDFEIYEENSASVRLPNDSEIFLGADKTSLSRDELGARLAQIYSQSTGNYEKKIYIAASAEIKYGLLAEIFKLAGEKKFERLSLVVKADEKGEAGSVLNVDLPDEFIEKNFPAMTAKSREGENLRVSKPNPFTLLLEIKADGKLLLNGEENAPPDLVSRLENIFRDREANGIWRVGTNEVEKTIFVQASRSIKYGEVAKVIDALKKAGAAPIVILTDDLSDQ